MECPRCPAVTPTHRLAGGRVRVECSKCGRLLGWAAGIPLGAGRVDAAACREVPPDAADHLRDITKVDSAPPASTWLYVSRRLDLFTVPNGGAFLVPLFTVSPDIPIAAGAHLDQPKPLPPPVLYYRLTPQSLAWFERAAARHESEHLAGRQPQEQMDEVIRVMAVLWEFADRCFVPGEWEALRAARRTGGSLPERDEPTAGSVRAAA